MSKAEDRQRNALMWIRHLAGLHYFGDAFDPEHMRDIANIAADALGGTRDLPDYMESMRKSRRRARKFAARLSQEMASAAGDDVENQPEQRRRS